MRWAILLFLVSVTACQRRFTPPVHETGIPVPDQWTADAIGTSETDQNWWEGFGDSLLTELVEEALHNNRDLRAAAARVDAALIEARLAGAGRLPQLGAGFSGARRRQNFIGFPIPGREGSILSSTSTNLGVSLDIAWEADLWGRIRYGEVQALAFADAEQAQLTAAQLSIAAQTSKAWFAALETARQLELAQRTLENYQQSNGWIRTRYEAGLRPSLDLRLSLSNLDTAESVVAQRREQLDRSVRQVEILAGRYPSASLSSANPLPELPRPIPAGIPSQLLARRPDLIAAERRLLAADAAIAQSRAELYPRLNLTSSGGTASRSLLDLLDGDFRVWSLMGNLTQPLFQGGRLRRGVELSETRSRESLEIYAGAVLAAFAEVETALAASEHIEQRLRSLSSAASQARSALELAEDRYRRGVGDVITVLESQRRVFESESQLLNVRRLRLDNRIDLLLALGGGIPTPPSLLAGASQDLKTTRP